MVDARDSKVLVLTAEDNVEVVKEVPSIVSTFLSAVVKRLAQVKSASPAIRPKRPRTVALLPIGKDFRLPEGFASKLAEEMWPSNAVVVSSASLADILIRGMIMASEQRRG